VVKRGNEPKSQPTNGRKKDVKIGIKKERAEVYIGLLLVI
jgi:hypothetical protein